MNPRRRQFALGGSLTGWEQLNTPSHFQSVVLKASYRGLNPLIYSRYGKRQWASFLPRSRVIIKDPFAMLSIPMLERICGCQAVLVYRHPAAVLASYRRMGWTPDVREVQHLVTREAPVVQSRSQARLAQVRDAAGEMGYFWSTLYDIALHRLAHTSTIVVSHADIAAHGHLLGRALFSRLDLTWNQNTADEFRAPMADRHISTHNALHDFRREPSHVARAWRKHVSEADVHATEAISVDIYSQLEARRLRLENADR